MTSDHVDKMDTSTPNNMFNPVATLPSADEDDIHRLRQSTLIWKQAGIYST